MHHRRHQHQEDDEQPHKMTEEYETNADFDLPYRALEDGDDNPTHMVGGDLHQQRRGLIRNTLGVGSASSSSSSSSSSSDWSLAGDANVMRQSLISNAAFFLGSGFQTIAGICDLISIYDDEVGNDDDDTATATPSANDDDNEASNNDWTRRDYIMYVLGIVGAGMYILNAISDFVQAKASERSGQGRFGSSPKLEIWAALTFGLAAILETITSVFWTSDTPVPLLANVYVVSMHIYFVSGALTLKAQGMSCYSCRSLWSCFCFGSSRAIAKVLMDLGGIFFLTGSTVDVVMSYLYDPAIANISPAVLAAANLLSSMLWFLDALLYIAADCMIYSLFRRPMRCFALCVRRNVDSESDNTGR